MIDLEHSLGELAERLEIPGGDRLVVDVVSRVGEPSHRATRPTPRRAPRLAGAVIALVVVALVALPGPRRTVARWLGFDSVRIEPGVTVPTTTVPTTLPTTLPTTRPAPTSGGSTTTVLTAPDLDLGPAVSIADAMARTDLPNPAPGLLGDAQSVHVVQPPEAGQIVLVYSPSDLVPQSDVTGVGALVSVMSAKIEEGLFRKTLGDTATVRPVDFDGATSYWIEGSPHQLMFVSGENVQEDTLRLATNTLLWQRGDHVYRLEADIDLATAVRIAKSVGG